MERFKQLPLSGGKNDYTNTENMLEGLFELECAIKKFYFSNSDYNPRQLHYILTSISTSEHLDMLIDWGSKDD